MGVQDRPAACVCPHALTSGLFERFSRNVERPYSLISDNQQ